MLHRTSLRQFGCNCGNPVSSSCGTLAGGASAGVVVVHWIGVVASKLLK